MMALDPLHVQCPSCGSSAITYTCEPKCCFNHICAACYTTFELFTEALDRTLTGMQKPVEERDCLAPTVACAKCESIEVYAIEQVEGPQDTLLCTNCEALLRLGFTAVESR
jgi:hypothetical protein